MKNKYQYIIDEEQEKLSKIIAKNNRERNIAIGLVVLIGALFIFSVYLV